MSRKRVVWRLAARERWRARKQQLRILTFSGRHMYFVRLQEAFENPNIRVRIVWDRGWRQVPKGEREEREAVGKAP
jgi:hypothetical protein